MYRLLGVYLLIGTFTASDSGRYIMEFEFTLKRDCLPYATFSMVSALHDLRQPTGEGILLNLVTLVNNFLFVVNMWNTGPPKIRIFGTVSVPFWPHYRHRQCVHMIEQVLSFKTNGHL